MIRPRYKTVPHRPMKLLVVALATLSAHAVHAAEPPISDEARLGVMERKRGDYEARGARVGTFLVFPRLTTELFHDSNVFATRDPVSDQVFVVRPEIDVRSEWSRHALRGYASLEGKKYFERESEDKVNGRVGFDGQIDIQRDLNITTKGGYARVTEDRGTGDSFNPNDDLVEYNEYNAGAAINKRFNRLYGSLSYAFIDRDFNDTRIDQDYRDHTTNTVAGRLGYEISPLTSVFVEPSANWRDYDDTSFSSDGWRAVAGVAFEPTRLMKGEVFAGYLDEDYEVFDDIQTWTFGGNVSWFVTPLLTVTVDGDRDTGASRFGGGSSRLETEVGVRADYELRRNIIVSGYARYRVEDYEDVSRQDETIRTGGLVKYLVNSWLAVGGEYRFTTFESDVPEIDDYDRHFAGMSATVQY